MALVKCRECEHELSKKADICPNCGAKQKSALVPPAGCVVIGGIIAVLALISFVGSSHTSAPTLPNVQSQASNVVDDSLVDNGVANVASSQDVDSNDASKPQLTAILKPCVPGDIPSQHHMCSSDLYKPVWQTLTSTNGEETKIDVKSIELVSGGQAEVTIYTSPPGAYFDSSAVRTLVFDCHGRYVDLNVGIRSSFDAPPESVAGMVADIVCASAKSVVPQSQSSIVDNTPKASDYCVGFSHAACRRIKRGVEAEDAPQYCVPGFAVVGNPVGDKLSDEQQRICWARE